MPPQTEEKLTRKWLSGVAIPSRGAGSAYFVCVCRTLELNSTCVYIREWFCPICLIRSEEKKFSNTGSWNLPDPGSRSGSVSRSPDHTEPPDPRSQIRPAKTRSDTVLNPRFQINDFRFSGFWISFERPGGCAPRTPRPPIQCVHLPIFM